MKIKKISDSVGIKVYTDLGDFFGEIEEANLNENKIDSWRIKVGGSMMSLIGGARGVIIPHNFVKSIGDIFIINQATLPNSEQNEVIEVPEELI